MNADSKDHAAPFSEAEKNAVYRVIRERRDMRHFTSQPVDPTVLQRLLEAAHDAPSVGLMQPWRFVRIADRSLRLRIHALVDEERRRTATALGERQDEFMRLKVEGVPLATGWPGSSFATRGANPTILEAELKVGP